MKLVQVLLSLSSLVFPVALAQSYQQLATEFITQSPSPYGDNAFNTIAYGAQRFAMACLYYATYAKPNIYTDTEDQMEGWTESTDWMSDKGVCEWYGITCDSSNFTTTLDLRKNNIAGTFPNEFSIIGSRLKHLDIARNPTGSFGSGIFWLGQMTQLTHLDISTTNFDFVGIPPYIGNLVNLKRLDISYTYFWGRIDPDIFSDLNQLEWLDIGYNYFDQEFPTEILANLPSLKRLYIYETGFYGSLDFVDQLPSGMVDFWADSNAWQPGTIPSSIFQLTDLKGLSLSSSGLTGTIPTEFGNLDNMERVWLFNNSFVDTIPREIADMENLKLFQVEDNMLTGSMPAEVCDNFNSEHSLKALASDCESEVDCECCNCCAAECDCDGEGCYQDGVEPPSDGGGGGGFVVCFSGLNTVNVADRGVIQMRDLKIGDKVQVGRDGYSRVYSFGHYDKDVVVEFLKLHSTGLEQPLEISKDHMVFVENRGAVPASTVDVGEKLLLVNDGYNAKVTKIEKVYRKGAFAPFTESGKISVNGVISSNYITMQDDLDALTVAGVEFVSMQWIAHSFQAPHRLVCKWNAQFCAAETYSKSGISNWVYGPYLTSKWFLEQHVVILILFALPVIVVAAICSMVESVALNMGLVVMVGLLGFTFTRRMGKRV